MELAARPYACFVGVHLVKIVGEVHFVPMSVAAVIQTELWRTVADFIPLELTERMVVLQMSSPSPQDRATAALAAAEEKLPDGG